VGLHDPHPSIRSCDERKRWKQCNEEDEEPLQVVRGIFELPMLILQVAAYILFPSYYTLHDAARYNRLAEMWHAYDSY